MSRYLENEQDILNTITPIGNVRVNYRLNFKNVPYVIVPQGPITVKLYTDYKQGEIIRICCNK